VQLTEASASRRHVLRTQSDSEIKIQNTSLQRSVSAQACNL